MEFGVLEIPLNEQPLRWIPIFHDSNLNNTLGQAQGSLSHDGRTWAVATTFIENLKPDNYALYLVDVSRSKPKITKVPIAQPGTDKPTAK
jgi:hypothetical protein